MKRMTNDEARMTNPEPQDSVAERSRRTIARWEAKYTPERTAAVLAAKAERMRERYQVQAEIQERVDHRVAEVTDAAGVPKMMRIWYKSFGREVCRIWRTIPSSAREVECDVARYKWKARGLDPVLLDRVRAAVVDLVDSLN
jgi:hypothetical protein